jgi:hypothetical protein
MLTKRKVLVIVGVAVAIIIGIHTGLFGMTLIA